MVLKNEGKNDLDKSNNSSDNLAILGTTPKVMAEITTTINNADGGIKRNDSLSNFANINLSSPSSPTKGNSKYCETNNNYVYFFFFSIHQWGGNAILRIMVK